MAGKTDWRAPSIEEFLTIVDFSRSDPAIDPVFNCQLWFYWSGSTYPADAALGWDVYFGYGYSSVWDKADSYYVRCVRGESW